MKFGSLYMFAIREEQPLSQMVCWSTPRVSPSILLGPLSRPRLSPRGCGVRGTTRRQGVWSKTSVVFSGPRGIVLYIVRIKS